MISKAFSMLGVAWCTLLSRLIYGARWKIGHGVRFRGVPLCYAHRGVVVIEDGCIIGRSVQISADLGSEIRIGARSTINFGCTLIARSRITIGAECHVGELVSIRDSDHVIVPGCDMAATGYIVNPVIVGDRCWIGRGANIMPGVEIGGGAVIGANAVVNKRIPAAQVWAGVPARKLREI